MRTFSSNGVLISSKRNFFFALLQTLTSLESRLVPYFFINHPTRGALAGPFRKLSKLSSSPESTTRPIGFLVLDVAATLLGLDNGPISGGTSKEAEALSEAVHSSLVGGEAERNTMQPEMREYWEHAMKRQNRC